VLPWLTFAASAAAVIAGGWLLARTGDRIAGQTGLSGLWIGSLLVASVTSLPEVVTGVAAAAVDEADLATGDIFGSSMANMLILAVIDISHRRVRVLRSVAQAHALGASLAIVLTAFAAAMTIDTLGVEIAHVGLETIVLAAVYMLGTRIIFLEAGRAALGPVGEAAEEPASSSRATRKGRLRWPRVPEAGSLALASVIVLSAGPALAISAREISEQTGLEATFVGVLFLAVTTSLPELASATSAVRMGAYDLAVGGLFGSNAFNMCALLFIDIAYTKGPLFEAVSPAQAVAALVAIVLMATAVMGLVQRAERRLWLLEPDAAAIVVGYVGGLFLVYNATT
jgi:cation:H+ antiporter